MGPHLKQAVRGLSEVTMSRFAVAGMEPRASPILAKCPPLSCMPSPELELLNSSRKLAVAMKLPVQLCAFQFECSLIFSYQARKGGYRDVRPPREPHRVISVLIKTWEVGDFAGSILQQAGSSHMRFSDLIALVSSSDRGACETPSPPCPPHLTQCPQYPETFP
jgi:hypothetical protein